MSVKGQRQKHAIVNILKEAVDIVFPVSCTLCGEYLPEYDGYRICPECREAMRYIDLYCQKCAQPLPDGGARCRRCRRNEVRYYFEFARALLVYEGKTKDIIHRLKYSGKENLGRCLGDLLAAHVRATGCVPMDEIDSVAPVPMHWLRELNRGYNQAEIIARAVAGEFKKELAVRLLVRSRLTKPQFGLAQEDRRANISGAFRAGGARSAAGKTILLIDDVATTMSTLNECSLCLKNAGAKKIYVLTAARGG